MDAHAKNRRTLLKAIAGTSLISLATLAGCVIFGRRRLASMICRKPDWITPGTSMRFPNVIHLRSFTISNPREIGKLEYHVFDKPTGVEIGLSSMPEEETERTIAKPMRYYNTSLIPLTRLKDGAIVVHVIRIPSVRLTQFGTRKELKPDAPNYVLDSTGGSVSLPKDTIVSDHIFLIQALEEETDWRWFETDKKFADGDSLVIPDLLTLPKLSDRPDAEAIWAMYQRAQEEYDADLWE